MICTGCTSSTFNTWMKSFGALGAKKRGGTTERKAFSFEEEFKTVPHLPTGWEREWSEGEMGNLGASLLRKQNKKVRQMNIYDGGMAIGPGCT